MRGGHDLTRGRRSRRGAAAGPVQRGQRESSPALTDSTRSARGSAAAHRGPGCSASSPARRAGQALDLARALGLAGPARRTALPGLKRSLGAPITTGQLSRTGNRVGPARSRTRRHRGPGQRRARRAALPPCDPPGGLIVLNGGGGPPRGERGNRGERDAGRQRHARRRLPLSRQVAGSPARPAHRRRADRGGAPDLQRRVRVQRAPGPVGRKPSQATVAAKSAGTSSGTSSGGTTSATGSPPRSAQARRGRAAGLHEHERADLPGGAHRQNADADTARSSASVVPTPADDPPTQCVRTERERPDANGARLVADRRPVNGDPPDGRRARPAHRRPGGPAASARTRTFGDTRTTGS